MFQYLVFLGAAVSLGGASFYARDTLRGQTKPNRATYLMWAIAPIIATLAALADGVGWAVLPVFMAGFGPLLVLAASYINKNAYWKLGIFDYACGIFSALALIFWAITKEPNVAIILAIMSDGLAAFPTLIKSWQHPETESAIIYATGLISALTSFTAVKMWNLAALAFPIYLIILNSSLVFFVWRRPKQK